jgi:alpha-glucosidase
MKLNSTIKALILSVIAVWATVNAEAQKHQSLTLQSPDGKLQVSVIMGDTLKYSINNSRQLIIAPSAIGLVLGNGKTLGVNANKASHKQRSVSEPIVSPNYRFASFEAVYNELKISFHDGFGVEFRVYNQGVAYRLVTSQKGELEIQDEVAEFNFDGDYLTYLPLSTGKTDPYAMAFQSCYEVKPISQANRTKPAFLPVLVDMGNELKVTITESDLEGYPGMFIRPTNGNQLKGEFARLPVATALKPSRQQLYVTERSSIMAKTKGARTFPWRVMAITEKDTELPVNNLVYALASPNRIGDCSWVKPGKSAWDWWNDWGISKVGFKAGVNTETYKHFIDFAADNGLEYIILDEGWYNPRSGNMMAAIPEIDLPALLDYGKRKKVDIILWTVFNVLDAQLEEACKFYSQLGIKGFKVDFLDRDDQQAVEMVYRIAETTAKYKLTLNLHGMYKPTGLNRTFPNILNFEGVFGLEEVKWSSPDVDMPLYDVTFPFIRMMAGPVDYTPGAMRNATRSDFKPIYSNPLSQGTRCHQLATYIVFDSPLTMLADNPTVYNQEQECTSFIASLPSLVDETKIVAGELGKFIVTARRSGDVWAIGGLTNWDERSVELIFDFLKPNVLYKAEIFKDGINANKQATDYWRETITVHQQSKLLVNMASGGGFAMRLQPIGCEKVQSVPASLAISSFYKKYLDANGLPIVSSANVNDMALVQASEIVTLMLSKRPDIAKYMVDKGCRVMVIGANEQVCDLPEYYRLCNSPDSIAYWNKRARGFGGSPEDDFSCSCGEENLLAFAGDRYVGENILVHEFAHIFHMVGAVGVNPNFDNELEALFQSAIQKGLWKNTYAITLKEEYFAEAVQSFFDCNRYAEPANGVHGNINRRAKLKVYDPEMYQFLLNYFPEVSIPLANDVHL